MAAKNNKGTTLVELILVVVLMGIIVVPLGTLFITNYVAYYRDNAKIKVSSDMRFALNNVLESFREAKQDTIAVVSGERITYEKENSDGTLFYGAVWYDSTGKCLKMATAGGERTLLDNVSEVIMKEIPVERVSITVKTITSMPFSKPYHYSKTYDYKRRI